MVDDIVQAKLFRQDLDNKEILTGRALVFAMLGWQTMLYRPSFETSPVEELAIVNVYHGYQGHAYQKFKQDAKNSEKRLDLFLEGFELLLPPGNEWHSYNTEEITKIEPGEFNAYVLHSIAHVKLKWVDTLPLHLEFNKSTNTMYLFRYPSFCSASQPYIAKEDTSYAVIHW